MQLFCDESFMVYSGVLGLDQACRRFERMLQRAGELSFSKRPVIDRTNGLIIGYVGADFFEFEGDQRLEFGYRLVEEARGRGYATEAGQALLATAAQTFQGEILAMVDPRNHPSQRVASKLGFQFWRQARVGSRLHDLYRIGISKG